MTRTLIATATALIAAGTLMSSAAQACLSCEYVPEVVRPHATSPLAYGRGQDETPHRSYGGYSAKRHIARIEEVAKPKKAAKIARIEKSEKSEKPAKVAKVSKPEQSEKPAKIAKVSKPEKAEPVKVAKAEPVAKKVEAKAAESESSSITVASVDAPAQAKTEVKAELQPVQQTAAKPTDCKKFFASVGMTLTVPCE